MRVRLLVALVTGLMALPATQAAELPIGLVQGAGAESPYLNRFVAFRGVVVGRYEDRNTRGDVYYTLFVQDLPGAADGDPATSDGIAVFLGRDPRSDVALGDVVRVGGKVTEFFGLTEMDDNGLTVVVEDRGQLPAPIILDPPAEIDAATDYFEALEGMRVAFENEVVVAGPTHEGCGFAVIDQAFAADLPILRRADDDPTGRAVPVLYPSDLDCRDIPQLKRDDRLGGLAGALTYNFDQFKIVIDGADGLTIEPAAMPVIPALPALVPEQIGIATVNLEDYFDTTRDTDEEGEPVLSAEELAARQSKFVALIGDMPACPTLLAVQEVEHEALLLDMAMALERACGFVYQVTHRDSPDVRGIDTALLSDPRRVVVGDVALRQTCSPAPTEVVDKSITCTEGQSPLYGRPPLEVQAIIDGQPYIIYVNHFKSKRGGEIDTDLERIQQAVYLNGLAAERLAADPAARLIALGDFNDTEWSPVLLLLADPAQGGQFTNALASVPAESRYSYNFGGVSELIDGILLSPAVAAEVGLATVVHLNTDFPAGWRVDTSAENRPFRATDHDTPLVILGQWPATPTPRPTVVESATPSPVPVTTTPEATLSPPSLPSSEVISVTHIPEPAAQPATARRVSPAIGFVVVGIALLTFILWRLARR